LLLINTIMTDPSVFLNAEIATLEMVPLVVSLKAPGRTNLENIPNAQSLPEGVTVFPSVATRYEFAVG
jgi:hypothetical protein